LAVKYRLSGANIALTASCTLMSVWSWVLAGFVASASGKACSGADQQN